MGCLCKSLLYVAYSPPATKHPPPTPTLMPGQIYFNSLLTDVVGFEAGKSDSRAADFKNGRPCFIYLLIFLVDLFSGSNACAHGPQRRKAGGRVAAV